MDTESKKGLWSRCTEQVVKYWQPLVTVGTLIFASGTLFADVRDIKGKMEKVEVTELQQAQMTEEIRNLSKAQDKQSEAIGKLSDAVNTLGQIVAKQEGRHEAENKKHK